MKNLKITLFSLGLLILIFGCKPKQTCKCTEIFLGGEHDYALITDSIISGLTKDDAVIVCDESDVPKTTSTYGVTYSKACELE